MFGFLLYVYNIIMYNVHIQFYDMYTYIYTQCILCSYDFIEGSLEVKLPTIWTDEKQSRAEAERRERLEERRVEEKE